MVMESSAMVAAAESLVQAARVAEALGTATAVARAMVEVEGVRAAWPGVKGGTEGLAQT